MSVFLLCLFLAGAQAIVAPLKTVTEPVTGQYIVVLKENKNVDDFISSLAILKETDIRSSIRHKYRKVLNGFSVNMNKEHAQWICGLDGVKYVEEAGIVRPMGVASWGLDRVDQRNLPMDSFYNPTSDGTNVNVYVIDTGINFDHLDFGSRAKPFWTDLHDDDDCNGHGSHCAGTIGGSTYGIAKNVNLFSSRVFGCSGGTSTEVIIAAMDYIALNGALPAVVSMSLGGGASDAEDDSARALVAAGFSVVTSAGNDNANACNYSPARVAEVISVGATDYTDTRSGFSNWGQCVDIFAPGSQITSCWYGSTTAQNTISGTSMACPHVSGAVAKDYQNHPNETPAEVFEELLAEATKDVVKNHNSPTNLFLYTK